MLITDPVKSCDPETEPGLDSQAIKAFEKSASGMSFTQTDDVALETFPVGFTLSTPVFPAVFLTKGDVGSFLLAFFHGRQVRNVRIRVSQCWRRNEADVVGLLGRFACFQRGSGFRFLFMESIPAP